MNEIQEGPLRRFLKRRPRILKEPLLKRRVILREIEPIEAFEEHSSINIKDGQISPGLPIEKPVSGRTFEGQSSESYCLECVEGHTMIALTEMRHALDRYRTAGEMTPGVTEKIRVAIEEMQGIVEDVKDLGNANPEVRRGLEEILDDVRWIRKEYGMAGKGLTRGYGEKRDLEDLRNKIFKIQNKAYILAEQCPTCNIGGLLKRVK